MTASRHLFATFIVSLALVGAANATPVDPSPSGTVISLTAEQVEAAKEAAAERNMRSAGIDNGVASRPGIHGEMGVAIGTGGYRSIYGTAAMPLGQDGVFAFSFENTQNDPYQYGYGRGYGYGPRYRR